MNSTLSSTRTAVFIPEFVPIEQICDTIRPQMFVDGTPARLYKLGMNALSFVSKAPHLTESNKTVDVMLTVEDEVYYEGRCVVVESTPRRAGNEVLALVSDGHLDLARLVQLHEMAVAVRSLRARQDEVIDSEYKQFCSDCVYTLRRYEHLLNRLEARCADPGCSDSESIRTVYETCEAQFLEEWSAIWKRGGQLVQPILGDEAAVAAYKKYTETVLTPHLLVGPVWRRSYEKPLGYPGDYRIMRYVYDWEPEGDTAYARLCHRVGLEVGKPVATRMVLVVEAIERAMAAHGDSLTRICSIGSGPAYEVSQVLSKGQPQGAVQFTLIDQEPRALADAFQRIFPITQSMGGAVSVDYRKLSYKDLLSGKLSADELPKQHLIYCVGLLDYLPTSHAQRLVEHLFSNLEHGGVLIIGNMKAGTDNVWPLKFVLDWDLIYRDEAEMKELTSGINPVDSYLTLDSTGYNYLMFLIR